MNKPPIRLERAEYARAHYFATIPAGMALTDVLTADYWVHVHKGIKVWDLFEIVAEDGAYDVLARVIAKAPGMLKFRIVAGIELTDPLPVGEAKEGRFYAKHKGRGQFGVMDRDTGQWVAEGFDREMAEAEAEKLNAARMAA